MPKQATFLDIIKLCRELDLANTNQFARRTTKIYASCDDPYIKVVHSEDGVVWGVVIGIEGRRTLKERLLEAHSDLSKRVKRDAVLVREEAIYPLPF